jgi:hypothetical protein
MFNKLKRFLGYIKGLFFTIQLLDDYSTIRVFDIIDLNGHRQTVVIPYNRESVSKFYNEKIIDIHRTLLNVYQNAVFKQTGVLFPIRFFDRQVKNQIVREYYRSE